MYIDNPAIYTDYYELTMAQGYFLSGVHKKQACFDYFFRKQPFDGGYTVFAGLTDLLKTLENYSFSEEELNYLKDQGFKQPFLDYLSDFRFKGTIWSVKEGELTFPVLPVIRVEGTLLETQVVETLLLNIINFQSLIATKAARMKVAAGNRTVLDFGLRRSQGLGGVHATRAAMIGGVDATSNVYSAFKYNLPVSGTMAHSWVQAFTDELTAFREYARHNPDDTALLVDTYDTLGSGVPNAITVAKEMEKSGHKLKAIRLDSGDLAYFSHQSRKMLDKAGLDYVKIAVSNQLDEYLIFSLITQKAPIDIFGVGTRLVTAQDSPALDGVYKLSETDHKPTLKISENIEKITLPGRKRILRYLNEDGTFYGDGIIRADEDAPERIYHPYFPAKKSYVGDIKHYELLGKVFENGNIIHSVSDVKESAAYCAQQLNKLSAEYKRFDNPHIYKVGISESLMILRDRLISTLKPDSL